MRKKITLLTLIGLCLFAFSLTGCKEQESPSTDSSNPNQEEIPWSDENVDNDGWT